MEHQELVKIRNQMYGCGITRENKLELLPENYVFDENESVKWNREQVEKRNAEITELNEKYKIDAKNRAYWLDEQIYAYLVNYSNNKLTKEDIKKIESNLKDINYDEKCDEFNNWLCDMESLVDLIVYFIDKGGND